MKYYVTENRNLKVWTEKPVRENYQIFGMEDKNYVTDLLAWQDLFDNQDEILTSPELKEQLTPGQVIEGDSFKYDNGVAVPLDPPANVESICQTCGGFNPVWSANNNLFNKVNGSPYGIICPTCFIKKANELGIDMFGIDADKKGDYPIWVCVTDHLPASNEEVYLKGYPRLDKGFVRKGDMLGQKGEYIKFYERHGLLSSYSVGHEELKGIFWLEEPTKIINHG